MEVKMHSAVMVSSTFQAEGRRDAESQLKLCEAELGLMKEEVGRLTQQLHQAQTVSLCDSLMEHWGSVWRISVMKQWDGRVMCRVVLVWWDTVESWGVAGCGGIEWSASVVRCVSNGEVVSGGGYRTESVLMGVIVMMVIMSDGHIDSCIHVI